MQQQPVIIQYKHFDRSDTPWRPDYIWQAIVYERGIRDNGTCYPSVVAIAENTSRESLKRWAKREGYAAREVAQLDLTPVQANLF